MSADPIGQLLGRGRLGVGEAAGPEHGDEQLDAPRLARATVDQGRPLTREVEEGLLAGPVDLPHRRPQPPRPLLVDRTELGAAIALRMDLGVLLPEELQRDAVALELAVDVRAVRPDPVVRRGRAAEQLGLEHRVVQLGRQRPAEPALRRLLQIARNRTRTDEAGLRYLPVDNPCSCLSRRISRIFLISSLRAGIASPPFGKAKRAGVRLPTSAHEPGKA